MQKATHISFLTLLYPSNLEIRLILILLGPLAVLAAGLNYTNLIVSNEMSDLGDAIQTVCNSTLTLLYTVALLLWGLLVNRSRAWRTDGGTAMFGCLAIGLAFLGTGINYLEVHENALQWLPHLVWSILLWQSWLGFWWWVGSGMYKGEVEDREKREAKKRSREAKRLERNRKKLGISNGWGFRSNGKENENRGSSTSIAQLTHSTEPIELRNRNPNSVPFERTITAETEVQQSPNIVFRWLVRSALISKFITKLTAAHNQATRHRAKESKGFRGWGIMGILGSSRSLHLGETSTFDTTQSIQLPVRSPRIGEGSDQEGPWDDDEEWPPSDTLHNGMIHLSQDPVQEAWRDLDPLQQPRDITDPPPDLAGQGMGSNNWWWRGPVRKARLRQVDQFPD